ncbi:hypothetical protein [Pseudomonas fluorescens]|uniref:Uncharacterized protein n=1 Tax=Pseudomonas fluorescens TaxID=294 RepID=A0A5E7Q1Y0_PSEFL|nr:hypothetical protein [Pseudomonas fluorescens]VVP55240.1 hypothetical protein PS880_05640 [Pseudomonas fluorescens]
MKKIIAASLLTVLSSTTMTGELVPACVEYFKQADQFIASGVFQGVVASAV